MLPKQCLPSAGKLLIIIIIIIVIMLCSAM